MTEGRGGAGQPSRRRRRRRQDGDDGHCPWKMVRMVVDAGDGKGAGAELKMMVFVATLRAEV